MRATGNMSGWALKIGTALATLAIFGASFGYAGTHVYATNAPLQPAVLSATATMSTTTASGSTTTLSSGVRTTLRAPVTTTHQS